MSDTLLSNEYCQKNDKTMKLVRQNWARYAEQALDFPNDSCLKVQRAPWC